MKYYYSGAAGGFFSNSIHGASMPSDVVEISEEEWRALLDAQSRGMQIQPDENGRPIAVHPGAA